MRALESALIRKQSRRVTARLAPQYRVLFEKTLARVEPDRWVLEWNLPFWLGNPFGLPASTTQSLAVSNVLGLAALRLFDDIADNPVPARERVNMRTLAVLLQQSALDIYADYFVASDPFWEEAARHLNDWHTATRLVNTLPLFRVQQLRAPDSVPARILASLGAPLKINAFAICRLSSRNDALADLETMLDHSLIAAVLHDHIVDWEADIQERRQNFFVNALAGNPYAERTAQVSHARVIQAWLQSDAPRAYLQEILYHLACAEACSRAHALTRLTKHFRHFTREARALYSARRTLYRTEIERAACLLFRSTSENILPSHKIARRKEAAGYA